MKLAVYSTKQYDKKYLQHVNEAYGFELEFFRLSAVRKKPLKRRTAVKASVFLLTTTQSSGTGRVEKTGREVYRPALRGL